MNEDVEAQPAADIRRRRGYGSADMLVLRTVIHWFVLLLLQRGHPAGNKLHLFVRVNYKSASGCFYGEITVSSVSLRFSSRAVLCGSQED